jgi:hypothetical protein
MTDDAPCNAFTSLVRADKAFMAGVDFIWDNPPYTAADTKEAVLRALVETGTRSATHTMHTLMHAHCHPAFPPLTTPARVPARLAMRCARRQALLHAAAQLRGICKALSRPAGP